MARKKKENDTMETKQNVSEVTSSTENSTEESSGPSLSLVDVRNAVNVIDYACEQGAFKGWKTIVQVQEVRNRLVTFLEAVAPAQKEDEAPSEDDEYVTEESTG